MDAPERLEWLGVTLARVTAVAALGVLAWLAARRRGPALRGAVVFAALTGLLAVPALAAVAPVWLRVPAVVVPPPGVPPEPPRPREVVRAPALPAPAARIAPAVVRPEPADKLPPMPDDPTELFDDELPAENPEPAATAALPPPEDAIPPEPGEARRAGPSAASILVCAWLLGVLVCLARAAVGLALLYRWVWRAEPVPQEEWAACLEPDAGRPRVAVRESPAVDSPLTLGLFRPIILLPAGWREWSAEQLGLVLAHELAHVRRCDFLAGLVAEMAVCLCWFHPLVRWLAGRLRLEQEYAADAWAASAAGDAVAYVRCLARLALEQGAGRRSLAPAFWRRRPEILRRIDMLRRDREGLTLRLGRRTAGAVVVLAAAACAAVAGVGPLGPAAHEPNPPAGPAPAAAAKPAATSDPQGDPLPAGAVARLGTTRWQHGATITYVGFGAGSKTLVTAGQDGTVRLWDAETGKEVRRFAAPTRPAGVRPQPAAPQPIPVRPLATTPAQAQVVAAQQAEAQAAAVRAQRQLAEAQAAAANAKALLDAAKPGAEADAAKAKLEAAQAAEARAKAQLERARAQLELAVRQQALLGTFSTDQTVAALSPDGKTIAVGSGKVVQLYEVETGNSLRRIEGWPGLVGLLFSPDGKTLAGRTSDAGASLWDVEAGKERHRIKAPPLPDRARVPVAAVRNGGAPGMTFTPDGKALVVVTAEVKDGMVGSTVKFWDVASGEQVRDLKGPLGSVSAVAIAPNGKTLVYCAGNMVRAFETEAGGALYEIRLSAPLAGMTFSPDGKMLALAGRDRQARVHDAANGKELYALGEPFAPIATGAVPVALAGAIGAAPELRTLAFSPDSKRIATAAGGTVRMWSAATGKEIPLSDGHQGPLAAVVLSADGKTAVSRANDGTVRRWDAVTGKVLTGFRLPQGPAAFSADGRSVAVGGGNGTIHILDTADGKERFQFKGHPRGAAALAFSPDGALLAERGADGVIRLYDPAKGEQVRPLAVQADNTGSTTGVLVVAASGRITGGAGAGLAFSPDGRLLASAGSSSGVFPPGATAVTLTRGRSPGAAITLHDVATGKALRKVETPQAVASFAFSPDGRVLATENADGSVGLWEVASGRERAHLGGRPAPPPAPAATPALVRAVGGFPGSAEPAGPTTLAFSPDGRLLVVRGPDRSARAWDVDAGRELAQYAGHDGRVETVAFSPDGRSLATGGADTTVLLWNAAALRKDVAPRPAAELPDGAAESLWADLAGEDAGKALQAVHRLAAAPWQAVTLLGDRLKPAAAIDPEKLGRWVADLESEKFAVRQEAAASLVKAGEQAVPALRTVLASQPTIETRLRVEALLDKLTGGTLTAEQLRVVRSVEALERAATAEAREVLRALAGGAAGALPTREARAALDRLGGR